MSPRVSLIVTTFNQPDYLARLLACVAAQSQPPGEMLLADDGSDAPTRILFSQWAARQAFACHHIWQSHEGYRRSRILNESAARATGPYLVFLDGDTLPHPRFVEDHAALARPGWFVQGRRALAGERAAPWFGKTGLRGACWRAFLTGSLGGLQNAFRWPFVLKSEPEGLRGVRGCNLAMWREDLLAINGYNEAFEGWGREDSDLVQRLLNHGARRCDIRGRAVCYHLWHPPASRAGLPANDLLLEQTRRDRVVRCVRGLDSHLPSPAP